MPTQEPHDYRTKIQRFEFKRDPDNHYLLGPDGAHYPTEAEALYNDTVGCSCGNPEAVHQLLIDCLKHFDRDDPDNGGVEGIERIVTERPAVVAELIGHYLNNACLAEHGGSVYGSWLSARGKQFIEVGALED